MAGTQLWLGVLLQVARSRKYTPSQDDVGFVLKYECSIFDPSHPYIDLGRPMLAFTSRVRPAPNLPVRNLVALPLAYNVTKAGPSSRFTVLSYNMLADLYAKVSSAAGLDGSSKSRMRVLPGCVLVNVVTIPSLTRQLVSWAYCTPNLLSDGQHRCSTLQLRAHAQSSSPAVVLSVSSAPCCLSAMAYVPLSHPAERRVPPLPCVDHGLALPQAQPAQGAADAPAGHYVPPGGAERPLH